jgi:hypothetical protein
MRIAAAPLSCQSIAPICELQQCRRPAFRPPSTISALLAHPSGNPTGVAAIIPPLILAKADEVIE